MASITICNLDDDLKHRLGVRVAEHGRSIKEEVREILRQVVGQPSGPHNLGQAIPARFAALGGLDLPPVQRGDLRHTFASLLVSGGASLEMIGRLLGHTQIGTTQRNAHLIDSPLRAGVNAVGEVLKARLRVVAG